MTKLRRFEFDIALSFVREDRILASELARLLKFRGVKVFYDEYYEADIWGKDLVEYFHNIFTNKALFVVPFISKNYINSIWARHEIRSSLSKAISQRNEYILPVKLDETEIPSLPSTIAYIDFKTHSVTDIADLCCQKLQICESQSPGSILSKVKSWPKEDLDTLVTCPMCEGEGMEWDGVGPDDNGAWEPCGMNCRNGKITMFEFIQWMWEIYNVRRDNLDKKKIKALITRLYYVFQDYY